MKITEDLGRIYLVLKHKVKLGTECNTDLSANYQIDYHVSRGVICVLSVTGYIFFYIKYFSR